MPLQQILTFGLARGLPGLINLAIIFVFTRMMGAEAYGNYVIFLSYVGFANVIVFQWLRASLLRFYNSIEHSSKEVSAFIFQSYLKLLSLIVIFGSVGLWFLGFESKYIGAAILLLMGQSWFELNLELLRANGKALNYGGVCLIKSLIVITLGTFILFYKQDTFLLFFVMVLAFLAPVTKAIFVYWFPLVKVNGDYLKKEMIAYGLPLTATFAMSYIVSFSDRIMLSELSSVSSAGVYSASYDVVFQTITILFATINLATYPFLIKSYEDGRSFKEGSESVFKILAYVTTPFLVLFLFFSKDVSSILFVGEYRVTAEIILPIIAVAAFLSGFKCFYFDLSFQLSKNTSLQFYILLVSAILNIPLNYVLIKSYGVTGAAVSTCIVIFFALCLSVFFGAKKCALSVPLYAFIKMVIVICCSALAVFFLKSQLKIESSYFPVLAYVVCILLLFFTLNWNNIKSQMLMFKL